MNLVLEEVGLHLVGTYLCDFEEIVVILAIVTEMVVVTYLGVAEIPA